MARIWSKAETQLLVEKIGQGFEPEKIKIKNRKPKWIRRKARRMNLVPRLRGLAPTPEQEQQMRILFEAGYRAKEMAEFKVLGPRSTKAVQWYLGKMRLVSVRRSLARKNRKVWINGEREAFLQFLRENSGRFSKREIAGMFNVKEITVYTLQHFLGVCPPVEVTKAIPSVKKRMEGARKRQIQKTIVSFGEHIKKREKHLERMAQTYRRKCEDKGEEPVERVCKKCGKSRPLHPKFFYHGERRTNFGISWQFLRTCIICVRKREHQKTIARYQQKYP